MIHLNKYIRNHFYQNKVILLSETENSSEKIYIGSIHVDKSSKGPQLFLSA